MGPWDGPSRPPEAAASPRHWSGLRRRAAGGVGGGHVSTVAAAQLVRVRPLEETLGVEPDVEIVEHLLRVTAKGEGWGAVLEHSGEGQGLG